MSERKVIVFATGAANAASVLAGLRRAGAAPELSDDPDLLINARRVVVPGVGSFKSAMDKIVSSGALIPLKQRILAGLPTLGICLGMQILCEASEESEGAAGLGVIPQTVRRFKGALRVPQLGWNKIIPSSNCVLLKPGWTYFANSYRIAEPPEGFDCALCEYGENFVAAIEKGNLLFCQFHPELSGSFGIRLLADWIESSERKGP